ncbi:OB-fold domain-containing protein [Streptacidiphilus sp. NEAU-YB345]|uniref:OB-fold domain-containing protein n=2 Tax=Streptacidiphilus fuscans TaxID=2789292 RepID=A0A931B5V1_9ACTN|nr:OB-fold domain-containing protein [Streptacidiphilus fuscans]
MIRHWCEAMGDANPAYTGADAVAPPAMLQAWTLPGLGLRSGGGSGGRSEHFDALMAAVEADGCTSVVATDCEQEYLRPLWIGERVLFDAVIESVSDEKRTALGAGRFVTTRMDLRAYDEAAGEKPGDATPLGSHRFRILKFSPVARADRPERADKPEQSEPEGTKAKPLHPRPVVNRDNAGFWDGVAAGELRFQRCDDCDTARFPWLPGCNACGGDRWHAEAASGDGVVYSKVTVHHPMPAAFGAPYAVALVELAEGVRVVSNVVDVPPERVAIGMPVRLGFRRFDDELALPVFHPAGPDRLPPLRVPITRTLVVAGAIASRDYQDVHHDAELARAKGAPDIFMNILTTNGLVGRYVTDWAGPDSRIEAIAIRLGVPAYPGDELRFSGEVTERAEDGRHLVLAIRGRNRLGVHVSGTVRLLLEEGHGRRDQEGRA